MAPNYIMFSFECYKEEKKTDINKKKWKIKHLLWDLYLYTTKLKFIYNKDVENTYVWFIYLGFYFCVK